MGKISGFLAIFCLISVSFAHLKSYSGYQVLRTLPHNENGRKTLMKLEDEGRVNVWGETPRGQVDIMVGPGDINEILDELKKNQISFEVMIKDVEELIANERIANEKAGLRMNWESYQRMQTIFDWMNELQEEYPETVSLYNIGKSHQGRDLIVLKLSKPSEFEKQAFWLDSTIHAREHISTSTLTYFMNELIRNQEQFSDILDRIDFFFFPIVNPDGYEYSHVVDRMWRKTLQQFPPSNCVGTDMNRNFAFHFGGEGSSGDPCSETFRGPEAWSEPEAKALSDFIINAREQNGTNWVSFATVHSYGQLWLTPWGYTRDYPDDYEELKALADEAVEAVAGLFGTQFRTGSSANTLYPSSGSSRDWAKGMGGFKYSYTLELRDTGRYGFVLPADQILDTAQEVTAGLLAIANHMIK